MESDKNLMRMLNIVRACTKIYASRDTLNKVREFIRNNPTVYCSTHTPLGYENLDNKNLKICRQIGNVRDVSSRKINLIKRIL